MNLLTPVIYAFIATFCFLLVLFRYLWSRQQIRDRLEAVETATGDDLPQDSRPRELIKKFSKYFESASWAQKKEDLLIQAGIPFTGPEFMALSFGVGLVGFLLVLLLGKGSLLLGLIGGVLGFYIPTVIVHRKIKKKRSMFNEQLPPALIMMANSMRSGYSYVQALDLVAKEMPYPIGDEFGVVVKEMNLGIAVEDAFVNLIKRVNTDDLDLVVTAFLIQRQVGGNLAELLDNIALTIRNRVEMKQKINTLTAQGKLSGVVVSLLPVVVVLAINVMNPGYFTAFIAHPMGKLAIGAGVVLQGLGIVWMKKIVDIDV